MLRNYLKIAVRNLIRNRVYALINIFGLSLGMALCILVFTYVYHELSFNSFHDKYDRIYRVRTNTYYEEQNLSFQSEDSPGELFGLLKSEYPEVISSVRVWKDERNIRYRDKCFREKKGLLVSEEFFDIFSFPFIKGDPKSALVESNSILFTETFAKKYFGNDDPIGKTVILDASDYIVNGVLKDIPFNTDLQFDYLLSEGKTERKYPNEMHEWFPSTQTFIILRSDDKYKDLEAKLPALVDKYVPKEYAKRIKLIVQPLSEVHLNSSFYEKDVYKSELRYMYIFSGIALFLLIIACINFINLSIGLLSTRIKEIGIRKVIGATKKQIIRQFFGEIIILCFIAIFIGLSMAELFLPSFRQMLDKQFEISYNIYTFLFLGGLLVISGLISGGFTALVLSRFQVVDILKTKLKIGGFNKFNKSLVVLQFSLSTFFIIAAIIVSQQLNYMKNKDLGFNKENVLVVPIYNEVNFYENTLLTDRLRNELNFDKNIINITGTSYDLLNPRTGLSISGGEENGKEYQYFTCVIDNNYFKTLELPIIAGREFYKEDKKTIIINESMMNLFDMKNPVGKIFRKYTIVGVVKNFYFRSLHNKLEALCLYPVGGYFSVSYVYIRFKPENISQTINLINTKWKEVAPGIPFEYHFLNDNVDLSYKDDEKLAVAIRYSSVLVTILSCLGILGLVGLSINRQRKEISIRKVFGASVDLIIGFLLKEYIKLIIIANIFAWPAAYYFTSNWLQNFEYRINMPFHVFILSAIITITVAFATIGYQTIKAAMINPVESLRNE